MKRSVVLLFACLCMFSASAENKAERSVAPDQARVLVLAALTPKQRQLPSLETDPYNNPGSTRYLFFSVTWGKTASGSRGGWKLCSETFLQETCLAQPLTATRRRTRILRRFKSSSEPISN